ncbi:MAG: cytidylate kinase family protein [Methanobrevibacter sp.]|uniref:(d)CMP kinase n=1 Tax=Methanobrevibacter sp. TaxID=66852 RepID=UPI0026DEFE9D|nr:cytidylate kinase family protein [Methanobrevibacter sp.]MDO5848763.1 cytidylate kinase family protein [Methanobrevibacter sp.]
MIITIGGLAGTGTTTAAKVLSEKLDIPYLSTGSIFRQMAKERGMSVLEFGELAENDTSIDIEIDKRQAELAESSDNLIIEGRLSAYFVEADLKLWLITPFDVRAARIAEREDKTVDLAKEEIIIREESEAVRYKEIHDIDISSMDIYDLVINSGTFLPEQIADIIINTLKVI